jgi:hypothetical protein
MATTKKSFDLKWLIPIGTGIASIVFFIISWVASHSGSTIPGLNGGVIQSDISVGFWQTGFCWFFVGFLVATIGIYFGMRGEK